MLIGSMVFAGLVAALHVYFLVLEMFLWTGPVGQRVFQRSAVEQESSKVLAANQGLYNGFLAAGLVWSMITGDVHTRLFFFGCVIVAGIYGGMSVNKRIMFIQAGPAAIGAALTLSAWQ